MTKKSTLKEAAPRTPPTLADELGIEKEEPESKYWTYATVAGSPPGTFQGLAEKWGIEGGTKGSGGRVTRNTRKDELSVTQKEEKGCLNRKLADLNRRFNRNVDDIAEEIHLSGQLVGEEMEVRSSGELADEERLSGELTNENRLSGKLTGGIEGNMSPNRDERAGEEPMHNKLGDAESESGFIIA
ncbi:hypothetical protein AMATHDRAFT_71959, partial [Amanita thiersii Skay4041]